jgi:hypothetical protein
LAGGDIKSIAGVYRGIHRHHVAGEEAGVGWKFGQFLDVGFEFPGASDE